MSRPLSTVFWPPLRPCGTALAILLAWAALPALPAQGIKPPLAGNTFPGGTWVNFESPHCKPITVASLVDPQGVTNSFLLVCNTEDDTLEIFQLNVIGTPQFVARIRVGMDPVSVIWREPAPGDDKVLIYTANMVGDSVSMIELGYATGGAPPSARLLRTVNVGDEPMHLAINEDTESLYVSLNSRGAVAVVDANTLATKIADPHLILWGLDGSLGEYVAIKEPRTVFFRGGRLLALASRGTHRQHHPFEAGFDLFSWDLANLPAVRKGLGTKNFNMALDPGSNAVWVVSGDAVNEDRKNLTNVRTSSGGLLPTYLHLVTDATNPQSTAHALHMNAGLGGSQSFSHCTDVAVFQKGSTYRVFVACFNNDAVGMVDNVRSATGWLAPPSWSRSHVPLATGNNLFLGPSSLAVKYAVPGSPNDPGDRLYVLNRVAGTISVLDPTTSPPAQLQPFPLVNNPTPPYITAGRRFLYSAQLGNGFNSCSSCHFDGRLDGLRWDLSDDAGSGTPAPFSLDHVSALEPWYYTLFPTFGFTEPKGEFVTQSLQGLVNFELSSVPDWGQAQRNWFTNAPYHWDGDRPQLASFNRAFVDLLGGSGMLHPVDMETFARFLESIHYPPNYEQPKNRKYGGALGGPHNIDGSGALRGMKLFHIAPIFDTHINVDVGRSCVHCHQLPEGSDNLGSEYLTPIRKAGLPLAQVAPIGVVKLPIESSALRGIAQKERIVFPFAVGNITRAVPIDFPNQYNAFGVFASDLLASATFAGVTSGLAHNGVQESINDFLTSVFAPSLGYVDTLYPSRSVIQDITAFVREFDAGVAPMIGEVITVHTPGITAQTAFATPTASRTIRIADMMEQARVVNCGLAVIGRIGGIVRGFWYDPLPGGGRFFEIGQASPWTPSQLLGLVQTGDVLVFEATPLGMDRRIANPGTAPVLLTGSAPGTPTFRPMVPNTAYERVPELIGNWDPFLNQTQFAVKFAWAPPLPAPEPWQQKAIRLMQLGNGVPQGSLRHEAPRRFRVTASNVRPGAILELFVPTTQPNPSRPPATHPGDWHRIELPIYPTSDMHQDERVWETAVELDPFWANAFALGGPWAKGIDWNWSTDMQTRMEVLNVTEQGFGPSNTVFDPANWNLYYARIINEDGSSSPFGSGALQLQPPGWSH